MTADNGDKAQTALHHGMLYSALQGVKESAIMGDIKEVTHKIHDVLKFVEEKFIKGYYEVKDKLEGIEEHSSSEAPKLNDVSTNETVPVSKPTETNTSQNHEGIEL